LSVANGSEAAKQFAGDFAHFRPRGVGIDFFHRGGQRTATANRNAKIVDGFGIRRGLETSELFQDPVHRLGQTSVFGP
jgi:hypothetical protein